MAMPIPARVNPALKLAKRMIANKLRTTLLSPRGKSVDLCQTRPPSMAVARAATPETQLV